MQILFQGDSHNEIPIAYGSRWIVITRGPAGHGRDLRVPRAVDQRPHIIITITGPQNKNSSQKRI
ncbi:hypothetical protein C5750_26245 [Phyllobacterium myrsinacearum]|uniref:Uncharacterized protein n=1 Tax=Phyllobacterium myrsinacearum TaxID=28101 RepID=A0A2S9J9J1_9HYPH|nr:hypothetical protein C5750_26245 [Phyllobacterium myrsinacearum]